MGWLRDMAAHSFGKIYSSITESSLWEEDYPVRLVFMTMLCKCDADGRMMASVPGLARVAAVRLEECEYALKRLEAPDPYSRTTDFEGRRIQKIEGGWLVLNYTKYRNTRDQESRREQNRQAQQRAREKKLSSFGADASAKLLTHVDESAALMTHADASAALMTNADESAVSAQAATDTDAAAFVINTTTSLIWPKQLQGAEIRVVVERSQLERLIYQVDDPQARQDLLTQLGAKWANIGDRVGWMVEMVRRARKGEFIPTARLQAEQDRVRAEKAASDTAAQQERAAADAAAIHAQKSKAQSILDGLDDDQIVKLAHGKLDNTQLKAWIGAGRPSECMQAALLRVQIAETMLQSGG